MDPDQCLAEIRDLLKQGALPVNDVSAEDAFSALAERVQALDEWLSTGAALPSDWR